MRHGIKALRARRAHVIRFQRVEDKGVVVVLLEVRAGHHQLRVPLFLFPITRVDPALIPLDRVVQLPGVAVRLRQIKKVA